MNLLFTLTSYPPSIGGAQLLQHKIALHLKHRHRIQILSIWDRNRTDWLLGTTLRSPDTSVDKEVEGIPVHWIGFPWHTKLRMLPFVIAYYPLMELAVPAIANVFRGHFEPFAESADLIHNVRIGREPLSYASYQAARKRDIPFVLTPVHHPRWKGWRYQIYENLYRRADAILVLTHAERDTLIGLGVSPERIWVIGMGPIIAEAAHPERFLEKHRLQPPLVMFLGQHYVYKGYRHLLEAARLVWRKAPETNFIFVGPAVGRSETVFRALADERIRRFGEVDLQTKTDALAACTLLCVPSSQESFGGVYTEAWSFGKPVIGCKTPAVEEVIADGVDGYLVSQDAEEIADRICRFLFNPDLAQAMGAAGRRKVQSLYSWEQIAGRTEQAYHEVLNGSAHRASNHW